MGHARWRWLIAGSLALNVPNDPAQLGAQLPGLCICAVDLAGMRVALAAHKCGLANALVALAQVDTLALAAQRVPGTAHRASAGNVTALSCAVVSPFTTASEDLATSLTNALAKPCHQARINRQVVAEVLFTAEVLPVGVLHPGGHNFFVRDIAGVFE